MLTKSLAQAATSLDIGQNFLDNILHRLALRLICDRTQRLSNWQTRTNQSCELTSKVNAVTRSDAIQLAHQARTLFGQGNRHVATVDKHLAGHALTFSLNITTSFLASINFLNLILKALHAHPRANLSNSCKSTAYSRALS